MATPVPNTDLPKGGDKSIPALVRELWEMVVTYVKQETLEPIKGLGRFIAFGMAGSGALAIGLLLLTLAALRALQTETGSVFQGHLSWVPYLIMVTACGGVAAIAGAAIGRTPHGKGGRGDKR